MKKQLFYSLVLYVICIVCFPIITFADEKPKSTIKDFSYEVIFSENQQNNQVGYFDLLMNPGEKQVIQVKLSNLSKEPMEIAISMNSAKTNSDGVIEYGPNKLPKDPSLKVDLSEIMSGPQAVTLPATSTEIVDFTIDLPIKEFEGYIAGGIQLRPIIREESENQQNIIQNKFAFLVGIRICESDTSQLKPNLKLNDVSLKLKDARYSLFVNLSNISGTFVENMRANIQIKETNSTKSILSLEKENMRMAPNSMIDLPISFLDQKISAGEYTADINITSENGKNWTWKKNFKFTQIEASKINKKISDEFPRRFNYWWLSFGGLVFLICIGIYISIKKKQKKAKRKIKKTKHTR